MSAGSPALSAARSGAPSGLALRTVSVTSVALCLVVLAFARLSFDHGLVAAVVAAALVLLSAIDIERGVIPNRIVLPASCLVLIAQLALFPSRAAEWVLAPLLLALLLVGPRLLGQQWMGMGDVKLALLLGAGLGWGAFGATVVAFVCVFPVGLVVLASGGVRARKASIPFGPFLSLGGLIILFGPHLTALPTG